MSMALSDEQIAVLQDVQEMLQVRMRELPRRYQHSLGVAHGGRVGPCIRGR